MAHQFCGTSTARKLFLLADRVYLRVPMEQPAKGTRQKYRNFKILRSEIGNLNSIVKEKSTAKGGRPKSLDDRFYLVDVPKGKKKDIVFELVNGYKYGLPDDNNWIGD